MNTKNKLKESKENAHNTRFRVNVLHRGKEKWAYCLKIERAINLQKKASENGLHSIICKKVNNKYISLNNLL